MLVITVMCDTCQILTLFLLVWFNHGVIPNPHLHLYRDVMQTSLHIPITMFWTPNEDVGCNTTDKIVAAIHYTSKPVTAHLDIVSTLASWRTLTEVLRKEGKERKRIYIAPFIYYVYLKVLRHGSHSFTCKCTLPAFSS